MKQFPKLNVTERNLALIQDNLANSLNPLLKLPLNDSNFLQDIDLVAGDNSINHGLGRNLVGWLIVRKNANELLYDNQDSNPTPQLTLIVNSSGDMTVSMVVF